MCSSCSWGCCLHAAVNRVGSAEIGGVGQDRGEGVRSREAVMGCDQQLIVWAPSLL
jgi:hypothetical protein